MSEGTIKILGAILLAAIVVQGIRVISNKIYGTEGEPPATEQAASAKPPEAKPETPAPAPAAAPAKEATPAAPAPASAPAAPATAAAGDADAGGAVFKSHLCFACHSFEAGHNGAGPSLAGIFGQKAGQVPGFDFSAGLKSSGLTIDAAMLDKWLQGPQAMVADSKMVLAKPVTDPKERADLIAYIKREAAKTAGQ